MKTIAISGKGGTGKTTLAALIIRWLSMHDAKPILAVDADANVNLNDLLGVELKDTLGSIREEVKTKAHQLGKGMTKQQFLEYKIQSSLVEKPDFDLIAMGRPEGPGCYCYVNNLLRDILKTLSTNYKYVVIDNQAGMEHLSRQTLLTIDYLLIVSDPSVTGVRAAGKISRLIKELDTRVQEKHLILNRVQGSVSPEVKNIIQDEGLTLLSSLPHDSKIAEMDQRGKTIDDIPEDSLIYKELNPILKKLLNPDVRQKAKSSLLRTLKKQTPKKFLKPLSAPRQNREARAHTPSQSGEARLCRSTSSKESILIALLWPWKSSTKPLKSIWTP